MNEIKNIHEAYPFYGYRKIHVVLCRTGFAYNIKKIQRLMGVAQIRAVYPHKLTSMCNQEHKIYPYLLRELIIDHPNQVWKTDITYIKIKGSFIYLVCIIDVFSRKNMGWSVSTFLDAQSCVRALEMALMYGKPEILNSDQGCQFTSDMWINRLIQEEIKISMDGSGRWADNIIIERFWRSLKYEAVFLSCLESVEQTRTCIANYIAFYNQERPHQALKYKTPNEVFNKTFVLDEKSQLLFDSLKLSIGSHLATNNNVQQMEAKMGS